jgi:hypothetical protein
VNKLIYKPITRVLTEGIGHEDTGEAAHQIIEAMRQRRAEVILTPLAQLVARCAPVFPALGRTAARQFNQLPQPSGDRAASLMRSTGNREGTNYDS